MALMIGRGIGLCFAKVVAASGGGGTNTWVDYSANVYVDYSGNTYVDWN